MDQLDVLVVEDETMMRRGIVRALQSFQVVVPEFNKRVGLVLREAESGEAALELLATRAADLLLLDQKLPGIQGLDVLRHVQQTNDAAVTIMVTAYASIEIAVTATKQGAFDFLPKPFTPEELRAKVHKAAMHLIVQQHASHLEQEKQQLRFRLFSSIAHELKAPLAAVESYLHALADESIVPDHESRIRIIDRCQQRLGGMRNLISDLLDLTCIESGQRKRVIEPVDVRSVARTALESVRLLADLRNIGITLEAPDPVILPADATEIEMLCNNLLSNAVKYNKDDGRVTVRIWRDGGVVRLEVTDTGIGMTEVELGRLFEEFVRIRNRKTQLIPGSGLGLSIVRRLVGSYQGDIQVESTPDVGSTFTVTLPAPDALPTKDGNEPQSTEAGS